MLAKVLHLRYIAFGMTIERYILRNHFGPFIFSLVTLMFVFVLQFLMKFLSDLVGKGLGLWVIIELIAFNLAWMVVLAVPMSVLIATLMAFGNMSANHEITAMRASGVSLYRMMAPVLVASIVITYLLYRFDNDVLPDANHKAKVLAIDIQRKKPTFTIVPGLFNQDLPGYSILVRKTFEHSNDLEGITIFDYTQPGQHVTITAQRGNISFSPDYRKLIMNLQDGEIFELSADYRDSRLVRFNRYRVITSTQGFAFERSPDNAFSRGDRELSVEAMNTIVDSLKRQIDQARQFIAQAVNRTTQEFLTGKVQQEAIGQTRKRFPEFGPEEMSPYGIQIRYKRIPLRAGKTFQRGESESMAHSSQQSSSGSLTYSERIENAITRIRVLSSTIKTQLSQIEYLRKQTNSYLVEIDKKYSIPAACIVFVLIGAPLGVMARRGGFGVAGGISLGFFLLYWACLIGGEKLADRELVTPFIGMWIANIIIGALGIYLTIRVARESLIINWAMLRGLIPKSWRSPITEVSGEYER